MKTYNIEDLKLILNNTGILLYFTSFLFIIPLIIILIYNEPTNYIFIYIIIAILTMAVSRLLRFNYTIKPTLNHAIITTGFFWLIFNVIASLPFELIEHMSFIDGFFESVSATTTTGLSMIIAPNQLANSTLFWRSLIGWIGGLGIIVLAMLGLFFSLKKFKYFSEAEGHADLMQSNIKKTISTLWSIYLFGTLIGALALRISGLPLFDALNYAMTAISTTGTDIVNGGLLSYHSLWAIIITFLIMLFGATSFITHYYFFKKRQLKAYFKDSEFISIILLVLLGFIFISLKYIKFFNFDTLFHLMSAITCGGIPLYHTYVLKAYPEFLKTIFIFLMFIGGSSASTAGGIKVQRFIILLKMVWWKTKELMLPKNSYFPKKFGKKILDNKELRDIYSFIQLYILFVILGLIVFVFLGYGFINSAFEVTSAQGNVGLSVGITKITMPLIGKIMLILNMLIGRLEIIPVFALFGFFINYKLRKKQKV